MQTRLAKRQFFNSHEDVEVRIFSFLTLIKCPTRAFVDKCIDRLMTNEEDYAEMNNQGTRATQ